MTNPIPNNKNLLEIAKALEALDKHRTYNWFDFLFTDSGTNRRELYPKHLEFIAAGAKHNIRAFIAGNRIGKSTVGAYELVCHMTGNYPTWWNGKRFNHPIKAWACAIETKQLRAGIQDILFGSHSDIGSGMIPKHTLTDDNGTIQTKAMAGTADCVGTARVRHYANGVQDGWSEIEFKTYEQGWASFQGAKRDFIWLDEEPSDSKVYSECLTRTAGRQGQEGQIICTFTPLLGYSTIYLSFLPQGQMPLHGINPHNPNKFVITATWEDCPHLSEAWKLSQIEEYRLTDPNSIDARTRGIAAVGSGRIYPIDETFVVVEPFKIPDYWPKAYGLDPGWNATGVVWIAEDPTTKIKYIYSEYKHGKVVDVIHAEAIKQRGDWIHGGIDPHGAKHKRDDGTDKIDYFISLGLHLESAIGDPTALRGMILGMFESGSLKLMSNCPKLLEEIRMFRYDLNDPNKPAKNQEDHLCDAMMYGIARFDYIATSELDVEDEAINRRRNRNNQIDNDRSPITGY